LWDATSAAWRETCQRRMRRFNDLQFLYAGNSSAWRQLEKAMPRGSMASAEK
jgi:hypothetical protein